MWSSASSSATTVNLQVIIPPYNVDHHNLVLKDLVRSLLRSSTCDLETMKTMSMFAVSRRCCWWMTAALAIVVGVVKAQDACSALRAGDVAVYLLNSDDPDQIIFYPLADIDADVEFLYVTDNAWTGTRLLDTEGTYQVSAYKIPRVLD